MPQIRRAEEPDELLEKATTMLSYCKSIMGERTGPEHFILVAAAVNIWRHGLRGSGEVSESQLGVSGRTCWGV